MNDAAATPARPGDSDAPGEPTDTDTGSTQGQAAPAVAAHRRTPRWDSSTKIVVGIAFAVLVAGAVYLARNALSLVALSGLIAFLVAPIIKVLQTRLRFPRWLALLSGYVMILADDPDARRPGDQRRRGIGLRDRSASGSRATAAGCRRLVGGRRDGVDRRVRDRPDRRSRSTDRPVEERRAGRQHLRPRTTRPAAMRRGSFSDATRSSRWPVAWSPRSAPSAVSSWRR